MKKIYQVEIEETLRKTIQVAAESESEAFYIAEEAYKKQDVVLNADDFAEYNIFVTKEIKDQIISSLITQQGGEVGISRGS